MGHELHVASTFWMTFGWIHIYLCWFGQILEVMMLLELKGDNQFRINATKLMIHNFGDKIYYYM